MKNNKNRKEFMIMAVLTIVISAGVTTAFAHQGERNKPSFDPGVKEAIQTAIENNDYQAWLALHPEGGRMTEVINEANFSQLVAIHDAHEVGDIETVKELKEELGIEFGKKFRHKGQGKHKQANIDLILEGDYAKWLESLPVDAPIKNVINEDNFDQWLAMHQAMEDGDWETVKTIKEGFDWSSMGEKEGRHGGMRKGLRYIK